MLLRDVELDGRRRVDVRVERGRVAAVGAPLERTGSETHVVDGRGGALLPGLADHHVHLLATAAALDSVMCAPPRVRTRADLADVLRKAASRTPGRWLRAVGYDESVAGPLDRTVLDLCVDERPVRVQHRGGALWTLNSRAATLVGLDDAAHPGIERDQAGRATGRLWRGDRWLRGRLSDSVPDLEMVGRALMELGVTRVTDATPDLDGDGVGAIATGGLPQRVVLMGAAGALPRGLSAGPRKLHIDDRVPPSLDELAGVISETHAVGRPIAIHCVTRVAIVLVTAAFDTAGSIDGDRIEHAGVVPPELYLAVRRHGLRIVTQPGFIADRGDRYLNDVEPEDRPHLYPHASLLRAGIRVAISSDAPFGPVDPWANLVAARDRTTASGVPLGPDERVDVDTAMAGLLSPLADPGGPPLRVEVGASDGLCLLHVSWAEARREPAAELVRLTVAPSGQAG